MNFSLPYNRQAMFIKVTTVRGRRYAQLVESFRNEAGQPRQQ
jgi:hypothetical protein